MKRKSLLLGMMLATVLGVTACSNSSKGNETNSAAPEVTQEAQAQTIDVTEVMDKVLSKEECTMTEGTAELLKENYGLDDTSVKSFAYQMPMMNVKSTEYLLVEVVSEDAIQTVINGINSRLSDLENTWSQYLPDQYELVKNSKMLIEGNYLFFFISENPEYAENVFLREFDPTIPEVIVKKKYQQITGILKEYADDTIVVTFTEEDGNEVTVNGTPFESIYVEGEFAVGDEVNISLENPMEVSDDHTIDAVIAYIGPIVTE